jgi:hypothetical protein
MGPALLALLHAVSPAPPCSCLADFDSLTSKIEGDYVAWTMEVRGRPRERAYRRLVDTLRGRAADAGEDDCVAVLRQLTDWFHDGHLFVVEAPEISTDSTEALAAARAVDPRSADEIRRDLEARAGRLDPVEGIWSARGYRVAVVRAADGTRGRFVAVMLAADSGRWRLGQIRAELTARAGGGYAVRYYAEDETARHLDGRIWRNQLFHLPPVTWARAWPADTSRQASLDPADPRRPTYRALGADAAILSVPSHSPEYRPRLDSLLAEHGDEIARSKLLIVDVRGDEGGSAGTTDGLRPFYWGEQPSAGLGGSWRPVVLSSPDNQRYFERSGWAPDSIVERMARSPGALLPLFRTPPGDPDPPDTVRAGPPRVAILIDGGTVSAGEAFVLTAMRYPRVTLFGRHTGGLIDYGNVRLIRLACRPRGLLLGYPMIANSPDLPAGALNPTGVPPDVSMDPSDGGIVGLVLRYYGLGAASDGF